MTRILYRVGTSSVIDPASHVLMDGEPGWDDTNGIFKIGNGADIWDNLPESDMSGVVTGLAGKVSKGELVINVKDYGAVGDGVANDTAAINNAIIAANALGGGEVRVPRGTYKTTNNIKLLDGVYLVGNGYGSHIRNVATSGATKCGIVTGNFGDITHGDGLYAEPAYNIQAVTSGDFSVTLATPAEASNFSVGDIVGIASFETWAEAFPENFPKYTNLNEIVAISGAVLTLRYHLPDALPSSSGNPTIRTLTGAINGIDGLPLWASKNCGVRNLRLTQSTGLTSGWYALFLCGINQIFEDMWMDDVSTLIGSNGLSHSIIRNLQGRFEAGFLDHADWQNDLLIENIHATRFAANPALNRIGLSIHSGADNIVRNVKANLDGWGGFSLAQVHRGRYDGAVIIDAGKVEAMLTGLGDDCEATRCTIINPFRHGIVVYGERHRVHNNNIPAVGSGGYSVYANQNINQAFVHNNRFGVHGAYTPNDRFFQNIAQSPNVEVYNNAGYVDRARKGGVNWAGFLSTNTVGTWGVMRTVNVPGTTGIIRGYHVYARGMRAGANSSKEVRLRIGTTTIGQISYATADTNDWAIEAWINVRPANNDVHVGYTARQGTAYDQSNFTIITNGLTSDTTITVEGQVANAADSVVLYQLIVTPISEQLDAA